MNRPLNYSSGREPGKIVTAWTKGSVIAALVAALAVGAFRELTTFRCARRSEPTNCESHLREIGQAADHYASAHGGAFPPSLCALFAWDPGLPSSTARCPFHSHTPPSSPAPAWYDNGDYVYVGAGVTASTPSPGDVIVAYARNVPSPFDETPVLYADGHAERFRTTSLPRELAKSKAILAAAATTRSASP